VRYIGALIVIALAAGPAFAQQNSEPPATPAPSAPATSPTGVVATTNNPNLAVATLRLENGQRVSKLVGGAVTNDQNQRVGTVDDLIVTSDDKITMAVVSVGGFLGMGSKLVAVPWTQLKQSGDHMVLPGATKETLAAAPSFQY